MGIDLDKVGSEIPAPDALPPSDSLAKLEKAKFSGDERREEEQKQELHKAFLLFIRVMVYMLALVMIIRFLHLILPETSCWITEQRLKTLDNFLFSGTIGAVVTNFLKRSFAMKPDKDDPASK